MTFLIFLIVVSVVGVGTVLWLLRSEEDSSGKYNIKPLTPEQLKDIEIFTPKTPNPNISEKPEEQKKQKDEPKQSKEEKEEEKPTEMPKSPDEASIEKLLSKKPKKSLFSKLSFLKNLPFLKKKTEEISFDEKPRSSSLIVKLIDKIKSIIPQKPYKKIKNDSSKPFLSLKEKLELNIDSFSKVTDTNDIEKEEEEEGSGEEAFKKEEERIIENLKELEIKDQKEDIPQEQEEGTAAEKEVLAESPEETFTGDGDELSKQSADIKDRYNKLESLYKEKCVELDDLKTTYENELQNRKEFNKLKDILEKELKDLKDKSRNVQADFNTVNVDKEAMKKKINLLEGKLSKAESKIQKKDEKIKDLSEQLKVHGIEVKIGTDVSGKNEQSPAKDPPKNLEEKIIEKKDKDMETGSFIEKMLAGEADDTDKKSSKDDPKDSTDK